MVLLLLMGLLLLATSVVLLTRTLAPKSRSARRVDEIQSYGFGADAAAVPATRLVGGTPSAGGDLVRRFGDAISRRFGRTSEADLRAELMAAGMYTTSPAALLGYRVLAALVLGGIMLLFTVAGAGGVLGVLLTVLMVAVGWMLPLVLVRRRARLRHEKIDRELPDLIDLLVVTVEAGLGFSGSLRVAAREMTGPLSDELRLTLQEEAMGLSVSEALGNLLDRSDTPAMRSFVRSVVQGQTLGVSIGTIMRNLAVDMRKRRRQAAEERAQKAPVKILFPLVFLIFPSMFIVLLVPAIFQLRDAFS